MKNLFSIFRRALPLLALLFMLPTVMWGETIYCEEFTNSTASNQNWASTYFTDSKTSTIAETNGWKIAKSGNTTACGLTGSSGTIQAYCATANQYIVIKFGDLTNYKNVVFSCNFQNNASGKGNRTITILVSTDGGSTWSADLIGTNKSQDWQSFTYNVPSTSLSNFAIKITNTASNTSRIDDIKLVGDKVPSGPVALTVPANLSSSNVTTAGATLSWDAVEHASSYTVKIGETEYPNATSPYSATGLTSNTTYTWTVQAVGDGTNYSTSDYADSKSFTTLAPVAAHTVAFNVGTNGSFKDGEEFVNDNQRVEASAGAGVALPEVDANPGFVFGGWSAADPATSTYVVVGDDGKYHPADNETLNAYYKVIPATPTFNVEAGPVEKGTEVTISCTTEGATIYYTTNGDEPTAESSAYSSAIVLTTGQTIKAIAVKEDVSSSVASATYTIATHTAKFSINGTIADANNCTVAKGEAITFPANPADLEDFKFQGWTKTQDYSNAKAAPSDLCKSATMETEDVTFYAVYANGEEGEPTLTKLGSSATFEEGDKIVIMAKSGDNWYGLNMVALSSSYVDYFVLDHEATIDDITENTQYVTLSAADSKWNLGHVVNGYLYSSSSNNLTVDKDNKTDFAITWNQTNNGFSIKNNNRWLACRSDLSDNNGANQYKYRMGGTGGTPLGVGYFNLYKLEKGETTYSNYCTSVVVREIRDISVKQNEGVSTVTKLNYCEGETFDPTGLEITVNYTEGDPEYITYAGNETKFSFSPALDAELTADNNQVTITYKDNNCQQAINVRTVSISAPTTVEGTYTVKVGEAEAVTAAGNPIAAKKGQKIVLASTANPGYRVQATPFVVKDEKNSDVKVSKSEDTYSFDMPDKDVTITAKFSKLYTLNPAEMTNGSITIKWNGSEVTEAVKGNKIVVDVTPNTHYTLASLYYMTEGSETQNTINKTDDVYSFTMEDANTTIYATFVEDEKHEAIFYVNGNESSRTYVYTGEKVAFPETNPEDEGGKVFMGWASAQIDGTQAEAPAFANETGVSMGNDDIPFYAVFASERGTKSTNYSKITSMDALIDGDYVIAYDYNGGTQIAMKNVAKTNNTQLAAANLSLSNSKYVKPSAEYIWNAKKVIDGDNTYYTIYNADAGKYVKAISSGVSLVDDAYNFTITWDNSNKCYRIQSTTNTTYYLHGFVSGSSYDFRSSTSGSGANYHLHLYRNESTVEYYAYCTTIPNIDVTLSVSGTAGYGTFIAPYDVELPEGLVAYTASAATETTVTMEEMELMNRILPAGTPVVLKNTTGETISQNYNAYPTTSATTSEGNYLIGSYELQPVAGGTYLLQYKNNVVTFNRVADGNESSETPLKIGVNRCYLQLPDAVGTPERLVLVLPNSPIATDVEAVNKYVDTKKMLVHGQLVIVRGNKMFDMNGRLVK